MFGPEDEPFGDFGGQPDPERPAAIRVVDFDEAGFQPVLEPAPMKGRDICPIACGNDHTVPSKPFIAFI